MLVKQGYLVPATVPGLSAVAQEVQEGDLQNDPQTLNLNPKHDPQQGSLLWHKRCKRTTCKTARKP